MAPVIDVKLSIEKDTTRVDTFVCVGLSINRVGRGQTVYMDKLCRPLLQGYSLSLAE